MPGTVSVAEERIPIRVCKWLNQNGFFSADHGGVRRAPHDFTTIGVLYKDPKKRVGKFDGFLYRVFNRRDSYSYVANICFNNSRRWQCEIFGQEYHELVKQLASNLATTFQVDVILLQRPNAKMERDEYYMLG